MADRYRALLFVDGNNWYHAMEAMGIAHRGDLDYEKISRKLIQDREWVGTRYYIGAVPQDYSQELYTNQRRFLSRLQNSSPLISIHRGRLEVRKQKNLASDEMRRYVSGLRDSIPNHIWEDLMDFAGRCGEASVLVEKAVDVMIALDMVTLALDDAYDHAYLLSADGDYTPAVKAVRERDKRVFVASLERGDQLRQAANHFFHLDPAWLSSCYRAPPEKPVKARSGPNRAAAAAAGASGGPIVIRKPRRKE